MPAVDRLIELLHSQHGERLALQNDREAVIYQADGASAPTQVTLSRRQINEMLNEILPDHYWTLFASGEPFVFRYRYGSGTAALAVSQRDAAIHINLTLEPTTASSEPAPTPSPPKPASSPLEPVSAVVPSVGEVASPVPEPPPVLLPPIEEASVPTESQPPPAKPPSLRQNAAFPLEIPKSLRRSEAQIRTRSGLVGLALGVITSLAAALLAKKGSLLGQMFDLRTVTTIVPVFISCLFFWAATICWMRWRRLRDLEGISSRGLLVEATRFLHQTTPAELGKELEGEAVQSSPLLRRLQAVIRQWLIRPNLQDADLVLQQHVANDEEALHAGYSLVKTFVWALPVLGLIGTVIGISLAVGGFASFLGGDIEDVSIVKRHLVGVTGGLSFAFLITLHGLLTSLLVMLTSSVLQTREEKLYATIQHDIAETFLPVLQQVAPEAQPVPGGAELEVWRESLQQTSNGILTAVRDQCLGVIGAMDERQRAHREQVAAWTEQWHQLMEAEAGRLMSMVNQAGTSLLNAGTGLGEGLSSMQQAIERHTEALRTFTENQTLASSQQVNLIREISEHLQTVRAAAAAVGELTQATRSALAYQETLQAAMQQVNGSRVEHLESVRAMTESLARLTDMTQSVLTCQETLQAAMHQLNGSRLEHLESARATTDALARLTETTTSALVCQETLQAAMRQLNGSRMEHLESARATADALTRLTDATNSALACQQTLQEAMYQLGDSKLESSFVGFVEALSAQSRELREAAEAVRGFALLVKEVQAAQAMLQRAMSQLHETGLDQTLAAFRDSLLALGPILASFRQPFVLQAIPVSRGASEQAGVG